MNQSPTRAFDATFVLPSGESKTIIVDREEEVWLGVAEMLGERPSWLSTLRLSKPAISKRTARDRAGRARTGGYLDGAEMVYLTESDYELHALRATDLKPTTLYSGIVEHNTWEVESWFWAFISTPKVDKALQTLEALYATKGNVVQRFTHSSSAIGNAPNRYTFRYGKPMRSAEIMDGIKREHIRLDGRISTRRCRGGGTYMSWCPAQFTDEDESLQALERAIAAFERSQGTIYKGYPLLEEVRS